MSTAGARDPVLRRSLQRSYAFKTVADYVIGPLAVTSPEAARIVLDEAGRFVAHVATLVPIPPPAA